MIQTFEKLPFLRYKTNSRGEMFSQRSHSHKEVSLGYIESGETHIEVDGQTFELNSGDLILIPAETVHICKPVDPESYKFHMLYFDTDWLSLNFPVLSSSFRCLAVPYEKNTSILMDALFYSTMDSFELDKIIDDFFGTLILRYNLDHSFSTPVEERMKSVHELISEVNREPLCIDDLAGKTGLNPFSFIRKYARFYGLTPHADIVNRRIQRAILLFETDLDLISIAYDCGFSDQSHFNKQFKLYCGVSPGEYRAAIKTSSQ